MNKKIKTEVKITYKTNKTPKPKDETQEVKWFKPQELKKMKLAYTHNEILKKVERIILNNNYKDGLLGEEFIIFKEYESVSVFFQSCNEGDYFSIECF